MNDHTPFSCVKALADLEGVTGVAAHTHTHTHTPLSNLEINKTKQKIEDNPLKRKEERKSCMFV